MSALNIKELTDSITDEEMEQMAQVERLIELNKALAKDRESLEEIAAEIIEQRREHIVLAGLDPAGLEAGLSTYLAAYLDMEKLAVQKKFETMRAPAKTVTQMSALG